MALLNLALLLHAIAKIRKHCLHLISRPVASSQVPFRIPRTRANQLAPIRSRKRGPPGYHGRTLLSTLQRQNGPRARAGTCTCTRCSFVPCAVTQAARTEAETSACQASLTAIRKRYGHMAERLIAMLLTFDALFAFRAVARTRFDFEEREQRALEFANTHRVWWEQFERVSLGQHKSWYPHRTQLTAAAQMCEVGDLWPWSLGCLESFHAEVGRVADRTGCKRKDADVDADRTIGVRAAKGDIQGPSNLMSYKATTTMASSIATRLVGHSALRDDEDFAIPTRAASRIQLAPEKGGGVPLPCGPLRSWVCRRTRADQRYKNLQPSCLRLHPRRASFKLINN